jgi:hypothetical protein
MVFYLVCYIFPISLLLKLSRAHYLLFIAEPFLLVPIGAFHTPTTFVALLAGTLQFFLTDTRILADGALCRIGPAPLHHHHHLHQTLPGKHARSYCLYCTRRNSNRNRFCKILVEMLVHKRRMEPPMAPGWDSHLVQGNW